MNIDTSNPLFLTIIGSLIVAVVGPILLLILQRQFTRKQDTGTYAQTLQGLLDEVSNDLKTEKEATREMEERLNRKISDLNSRLQEAENKQIGPFEVKVQLITQPKPLVTHASVELMNPK